MDKVGEGYSVTLKLRFLDGGPVSDGSGYGVVKIVSFIGIITGTSTAMASAGIVGSTVGGTVGGIVKGDKEGAISGSQGHQGPESPMHPTKHAGIATGVAKAKHAATHTP